MGAILSAEARRGDPVELARDLIRIESINPCLEEGGAGEGPISSAIAELLDGWGITPAVHEIAPGRFNLEASLGEGPGPTLLLNGHLDTVGVAGMTDDPFASEIVDGHLRGRGACDMKAGLAIILAATYRLATEHRGGSTGAGGAAGRAGRIHLLFTADEEHASRGMQAAVEDGLAADFGVVTEPTSLAVMPAHKGFAWVRVEVRGRAAHGSRPEVGVDAIRGAARILARLDDLDTALRAGSPHPLLGYGSVHAGTITGGSAPSVYPDRCEFVLERRTLPAENPAGFEGEVRTLVEGVLETHPDLDVTVSTELVRDGSDLAPDHPGVVALLEAAEAGGEAPRVEGMSAWVDAAWLNAAGIPAVCFGPGSIGEAHAASESVPVHEIVRGAEILTRFARDFPDLTPQR
ncbi:MAG: M20/M25/M40 family metallo-hydrolase [Longimicrobiales bacterium]|nr:M20/M25/M40 family metallo-hydrolase [Longimicrobiales bacterium]